MSARSEHAENWELGSGGKERTPASFGKAGFAFSRSGGRDGGVAGTGGSSPGAGAGGRDAAGGSASDAGTGGTAASGGSLSAGAGGDASTGGSSDGGTGGAAIHGLPSRAEILEALNRANDYFVAKWPDPGANIRAGVPSHVWHRAVYFEGLMALHAASPSQRYVDYATAWGESHAWGLYAGASTRHADNQCAGQTYIDLYSIEPEPARLRDIRASVDAMLDDAEVADWWWVDAIQMAMPVFAKLGRLSGDDRYYAKMYLLYSHTKNSAGVQGLFNRTDHLWWRDATFAPPYTAPNGEDCYWSRGNGWVYAGLARVLEIIPESEAHRAEYLEDFRNMSVALSSVQRSDGFWNVSLEDPTHFGGRELTGTALFTYAMAWGVRRGTLDEATYRPLVVRAFNGMLRDALHPDGALGYAQSTGNDPSDGQPLSYDRLANMEDFALGCFLLAGSEMLRLSSVPAPAEGPQ